MYKVLVFFYDINRIFAENTNKFTVYYTPENAVMKNSGYMRSYEVNYGPLIGYFTNSIIALVFSSMGILYMFDNTVCHREIIPGVVISVVSSGTKYQMEH